MEKISLSKLKEFLFKATLEELQYELGYYCDPHRTLLREKKYSYEVSKNLREHLSKEIASRCMDDLLMNEILTETE